MQRVNVPTPLGAWYNNCKVSNVGKKHRDDLVFLLDVDNTLLDNGRAKAEMQAAVLGALGAQGAARFWKLYDEVRKELDVVNYPETLKRFADSWEDKVVAEKATEIINDLPYAKYLYPGTMRALECLSRLGN